MRTPIKTMAMRYFVLTLTFLVALTAPAQQNAPCGEAPELNKQIIRILTPYNGKKIGRGECWDAAQLALDKSGAHWDGEYGYGKIIDTAKECVYPGDIVQFENVRLEFQSETGGFVETFGHHTAIVYKVNGPGDYQLFHQNTGQYGRKMGITDLNTRYITKGTLTFYRPVSAP